MAYTPTTGFETPGQDQTQSDPSQQPDPWGRPPGSYGYGIPPTTTGRPASPGQPGSGVPAGASNTIPGKGVPNTSPYPPTTPTGGNTGPYPPLFGGTGGTGTTPTQPGSQAPSSSGPVNPLSAITTFQQTNPNASIQDLVRALNAQGIAATIATHAGGTQASTDKIVLPDGTYYDIRNDRGWQAPGTALHWDPSVNVVDPNGNIVNFGQYMQSLGLPVPTFTPTPGDGLPLPGQGQGAPSTAGYTAPGAPGAIPGPVSTGGGGATAPTPSVAAQTAAQLSAAPTASSGLQASLENILAQKMNQSLDVNPNDPIIRRQMDAYSAQQQNAERNYLSAIAEKEGPSANISAETRTANEQVGQATAGFEAQLMQQELMTRRQEIMQALSQTSAYVTDEQKIALQDKLAQLDNALQYARLGEQGSEFTRGLAEQSLEAQMANQLAYAGLGEQRYQFDTTRSDNLFG